MNTRFLLLLIGLMMASPLAMSQKCKLKIDESDKITGERHRVSWQQACAKPRLFFVVDKTGKDIKFNISYYTAGVDELIIPEGTKLSIKFENGDLIELESTTKTNGKSTTYGTGIITVFDVFFPLTEEQIKKMSTDPIVFVRTPHGNQNFDFNVEKKYQKKVLEGMACMVD